MSAGEQLWVVLAEAGLVSGVASSLHILSLGLASLAQLLRIELIILHKELTIDQISWLGLLGQSNSSQNSSLRDAVKNK